MGVASMQNLQLGVEEQQQADLMEQQAHPLVVAVSTHTISAPSQQGPSKYIICTINTNCPPAWVLTMSEAKLLFLPQALPPQSIGNFSDIAEVSLSSSRHKLWFLHGIIVTNYNSCIIHIHVQTKALHSCSKGSLLVWFHAICFESTQAHTGWLRVLQ